MPYRIRPDGNFAAEVCRVGSSQLDRAINSFEQQPDGLHKAVHTARKKLKRTRNLLKLVAIDAKDIRRRENARLRDTARSLSAVRDATALIDSMNYLKNHALNGEEAKTVIRVRATLADRRDRIAASQDDFVDRITSATTECRAAAAAFAELQLPEKPKPAAKLLAKGWKRALTRAHAALEVCHGSGHGEAFHDLRKAGQAYWMNLALLRDVWPTAFAAKRIEAKQLVDTLGCEQDLSVLLELIDHEPDLFGSSEALSHLLAMIIRQQQDLRRLALQQADRVFADSPEREAAIVATLWLEATTA